MPLSLLLTITGTVDPNVVSVQVNDVQATLSGTTYTAEVPVSLGVVSIVARTATGQESIRTMQVMVTDSVVA
jgi:bifunctional DNase/RNase